MNTNDIAWKTIDKFFSDNKNVIVKHHLDSYNSFFSHGIKDIFKDRNPLRIFKELDKETKLYKYECDIYLGGENADRIYYGKPIIFEIFYVLGWTYLLNILCKKGHTQLSWLLVLLPFIAMFILIGLVIVMLQNN